MIKALLVDLDGTLLDDESATKAAMRAFYQAHRSCLPGEEISIFAQRWGQASRRHWQRFVDGELTFVGQQRERVREVLALSMPDVAADQAFAPYMNAYESAWRCFDDVAPFLEATRQWPKLAVTNGARHQQRAKMVATGLITQIPDLVTPEEAKAWKPDPAIFLHALHVLNVRPEEVMMIGDDHPRDIEPAARLGMRTFWVRRGHNDLCAAVALLKAEQH